MDDHVRIFDTTLRDGEQSPGFSMTPAEKLELARQLEALRVDVIEAGFPISSPGDLEGVRTIARELRQVTVAGLARANPRDVEAAIEALRPAARPRVHVFIATSPIHMRDKLRMRPDEVVAAAEAAVRQARRFCDDVEFSAEDATRSEIDFLCRIFDVAIQAGATTINVPDTVGYTTPGEYAALFQTLRERIPASDRVVWSVHCHNDLGLAVANSLAGVGAGARQVECTINGIGERAGNAALEEIVMALRTRRDVFGITTRVDTTKLYRTSRLLVAITGVAVQPNKAVVGENAFAHEAGIHQHGVLVNRATYEIMRPEDIGLPTNRLVLGKHSGRHAFRKALEDHGVRLDEEALARAFQRFKEVADRKKQVTLEDILALVDEEVRHDVPARFVLKAFQVSTGTASAPAATVTLQTPTGMVTEAGTGDGPVDALCAAVNRLTGAQAQLADYAIRAVTGGTDALGEVTVRVREGDVVVTGRASSTDVLEASVRAYLDAINRLAAAREAAEPTETPAWA
ncbi:MAG: 2-isopropylmalate synthase [Armatimonadota bacterium]|nr:2-isopropylmalate synthase [Armatimonadota bacterium]MDR7532655.1 2-isopropylmalate synthase [Armatimonadota bacterium]MDR7536306.1 2-isopropylmalate synthase [Armatimonadota bacterium]